LWSHASLLSKKKYQKKKKKIKSRKTDKNKILKSKHTITMKRQADKEQREVEK